NRTVMIRMKELGIQARSGSEAVRLRYSDPTFFQSKIKTKNETGLKWISQFKKKYPEKVGDASKWSKYEVEAAQFLLPLGFTCQFKIDGYRFDFGHPSLKIIIEIDGGGWHGSKSMSLLDNK